MEWPEKIRLLFEKHREGLVTLDQVEKILILMDPKPKPRKRGRPSQAKRTLTALEYRRGRFMHRLRSQNVPWESALQQAFEQWPVDEKLIRESFKNYRKFLERHKLTRLDREFRISLVNMQYGGADRDGRKMLRRVEEAIKESSRMNKIMDEWVRAGAEVTALFDSAQSTGPENP